MNPNTSRWLGLLSVSLTATRNRRRWMGVTARINRGDSTSPEDEAFLQQCAQDVGAPPEPPQ